MSLRFGRLSEIHIVGVGDILPPIVMDAVLATGHFGKVLKPPEVMKPDIAQAPFCGSDGACGTGKIRKVVQPIITCTVDGGGVVPIVVAVTVGGEVNIAQRGLARMRFFVADEPAP